jgi:hypothetical protein
MAALSAIRYNPQLRGFYRCLLERVNPTKVALTAVMRKLLIILNAMLASWSPHVLTPGEAPTHCPQVHRRDSSFHPIACGLARSAPDHLTPNTVARSSSQSDFAGLSPRE